MEVDLLLEEPPPDFVTFSYRSGYFFAVVQNRTRPDDRIEECNDIDGIAMQYNRQRWNYSDE